MCIATRKAGGLWGPVRMVITGATVNTAQACSPAPSMGDMSHTTMPTEDAFEDQGFPFHLCQAVVPDAATSAAPRMLACRPPHARHRRWGQRGCLRRARRLRALPDRNWLRRRPTAGPWEPWSRAPPAGWADQAPAAIRRQWCLVRAQWQLALPHRRLQRAQPWPWPPPGSSHRCGLSSCCLAVALWMSCRDNNSLHGPALSSS